MRALALLLILANIIFFAWQQGWLSWLPWQPEQFEKTVSAVPPTKMAQLTLLSERQASTVTENKVDTPPVSNTQPVAVKEDSVEKSTDSPTTTTVPKTESTIEVEKVSQPIKVVEESQKSVVPLKSEEPSHPSVEPPLVSQDKEVTNKEAETVATPEVSSATTSTETLPSQEKKVSSHAPLAASPTKIILPPPTGETSKEQPVPGKVSEQDKNTTTKKTEHRAIAEKETAHTQEIMTTASPEKTKKQSAVEKQKISDQDKKGLTPQKVKTQPKSTTICLQVGPYPQAKSMGNVVTWFNGQKNVTTQVQKRQTPVLKRTRVYLPPFKNRTEALNVQKRLSQQGVNDHQILTDKKLNNAISLGVYRDQLSVQRRFEELNNKGYKNIKAEKYYESDTKYWLSVKIPASQNKLVSTFKKEFKGTRVVSTACEESLP